MKQTRFHLCRQLFGFLLLFFVLGGSLPTNGAPQQETPAQKDERMKWWRDAKFGLFIHWGVYAVPAGTYHGQQIAGIGEWILRNAKIPVAEYRAYAKEFNPVKYDPSAWAKLAREAGMRYIVITSKHHDGFALFPSEVTDWDVVDATPYKKGLIGPLAEAARKEGLKFGLYYSQAQDWTHPGGAKAGYDEGESWDEANKGSFDEYLKKIAVPQTREILTQYSPDILWWDTPRWMTPERAKPLHDLIRLRPGLITNNRLGGGYSGDTETPEQSIPATGFPDRDWEVCMTMNDTWGYKSYDQNWKSTGDLIRKLVDIVSKGGNFLLNVGPTAAGEIPGPSIERLKAIGAWIKMNQEAIYGTTASPFHRLFWGRCTKKVSDHGATLYLHVFDWPSDGVLPVPGLKSVVRSATLLASGKALQTNSESSMVRVLLPPAKPDPVCTVIKLDVAGPLQVDSNLPVETEDGTLILSASFADITNRGYGQEAILADRSGGKCITNWVDERTRVAWIFGIKATGTFKVLADLACESAGSQMTLRSGKNQVSAAIPVTGSPDAFKSVELGEIMLEKTEFVTLGLSPVAKQWKPVSLRSLKLVRVPKGK